MTLNLSGAGTPKLTGKCEGESGRSANSMCTGDVGRSSSALMLTKLSGEGGVGGAADWEAIS